MEDEGQGETSKALDQRFVKGWFIKLYRVEGKMYFEYLPVGLTSLDMSNSYL